MGGKGEKIIFFCFFFEVIKKNKVYVWVCLGLEKKNSVFRFTQLISNLHTLFISFHFNLK